MVKLIDKSNNPSIVPALIRIQLVKDKKDIGVAGYLRGTVFGVPCYAELQEHPRRNLRTYTQQTIGGSIRTWVHACI